MKLNTALTILMAALFLGSIFAVVQPASAVPGHSSAYLPFPGSYFKGNITIEPDGSLNVSGAPISHNGNYYNLTGNINGSIFIQHNGTILNGNGHGIYSTFPSGYEPLNVSNANNVTVSNLGLNTTNYAPPLFVSNSSHDSFSMLNISGLYTGFAILGNTSYVNVSNSVISAGNAHLGSLMGYILGGKEIRSFPEFTPSNSSSHLEMYNDTVSAYESLVGGFIGAEHSLVINSHFNITYSQIASYIGASNVTFSGNTMKAYGTSTALGVFPFYGPSEAPLHNVSITGNNINTTGTFHPQGALNFTATGTIDGNTLSVNASRASAIGINPMEGNTTVMENNLLIYNGGPASNQITGISSTGSNQSITENSISISGGSGTGIQLNGKTNAVRYSTVSGNTIAIRNTGGSGTGISSIPNNIDNSSIAGNTVTISAKNTTGVLLTGSYDSITGNTINVDNSTGSGTNGGIFIEETSTARGIIISGNYVNDSRIGSRNGAGIQVSGAPGLQVVGNSVIATGVADNIIVSSSNHARIDGNFITNTSGGGYYQDGISLYGENYISISNNTIQNVGYGVWESTVSYLNFTGNTVSKMIQYFVYIDGGTNFLIYHNNFISAPSGLYAFSATNVELSSTYPVGGNYWAANSNTADRYSGPSQNIPGADGISDSSYTGGSSSSGTLVDSYPLMKMWIRPHATFHENGLLKGSKWSVTFNGQKKTSDQATITFYLVNATYQSYSYSVSTVSGYKGGGISGVFDYQHDNYSSATTYVPKYTLTFAESGLPSGTAWNLKLNGTDHNITTDSYSVTALNGTAFTYSLANTTLYYQETGSGSLVLKNGNATVSAVYKHYSFITGDVSPNGASVFIDGKDVSVANGTFNVSVTNGSFTFEVKDSGYRTYYNNFTLGGDKTKFLNVTLSEVSGGNGLANISGYLIGGAVAAILVAGAGVTVFMRRRR